MYIKTIHLQKHHHHQKDIIFKNITLFISISVSMEPTGTYHVCETVNIVNIVFHSNAVKIQRDKKTGLIIRLKIALNVLFIPLIHLILSHTVLFFQAPSLYLSKKHFHLGAHPSPPCRFPEGALLELESRLSC